TFGPGNPIALHYSVAISRLSDSRSEKVPADDLRSRTNVRPTGAMPFAAGHGARLGNACQSPQLWDRGAGQDTVLLKNSLATVSPMMEAMTCSSRCPLARSAAQKSMAACSAE